MEESRVITFLTVSIFQSDILFLVKDRILKFYKFRIKKKFDEKLQIFQNPVFYTSNRILI